MQDINDLKPLMPVQFPWLSFGLTLFFILGLLLLFAWFVRRLLKQHKTEPVAKDLTPDTPRKPPREEALEALKTLAQESLSVVLFYQKLESILREFLEVLHREPITGYTVQEILDYLKSHGDPPPQEFQIEHLFQHGQAAKFAAGSIPTQTQQQDFEAATDFVRRYTVRI